MAVNVGSAVGYLDLDISKFKSALSEAQKEAQESAKTLENTLGNGLKGVGDTLSSAGSVLTKGITTPIIGAGAAAIKTTAAINTMFTNIKIFFMIFLLLMTGAYKGMCGVITTELKKGEKITTYQQVIEVVIALISSRMLSRSHFGVIFFTFLAWPRIHFFTTWSPLVLAVSVQVPSGLRFTLMLSGHLLCILYQPCQESNVTEKVNPLCSQKGPKGSSSRPS